MRLPDKRKRIDSDAGFLLVSPAEARLLGKDLEESEGFDLPGAYKRTKDDLERKRAACAAEAARREGVDPDDEDMMVLCTGTWAPEMGKAVGSMYGKSNVKFVDWGSFKMCAVFSDGHALKLSVKKGGLEEEIENARKFPNFTCFPKLVDWHSGFSSCVVEAVEPDFGDERCAEFYGVTREQVAEVLAGACGPSAEGCSFARKPANEAELRFLAKVKDEDGPEWESMRGLLKFFQAKGPLYDIAYGNWGLAVRGSARVPVILDHDV